MPSIRTTPSRTTVWGTRTSRPWWRTMMWCSRPDVSPLSRLSPNVSLISAIQARAQRVAVHIFLCRGACHSVATLLAVSDGRRCCRCVFPGQGCRGKCSSRRQCWRHHDCCPLRSDTTSLSLASCACSLCAVPLTEDGGVTMRIELI